MYFFRCKLSLTKKINKKKFFAPSLMSNFLVMRKLETRFFFAVASATYHKKKYEKCHPKVFHSPKTSPAPHENFVK